MADREVAFPCPVRRISVVWRDGEWTVEDEIRIKSMTLPQSHKLPETPQGRGVSGFWYEAVDRQGSTIYRQVLDEPFDAGMEVFDEDGSIKRKREPAMREVSFDILVPDVAELSELHFYSSTDPSDYQRELSRQGPAERIATIDLRSRKGGGYGRQ